MSVSHAGTVTRGVSHAAVPPAVSSGNLSTLKDFSFCSAVVGRGGTVTFKWPGWGREGGEAKPPWECEGKELRSAAQFLFPP